MISVTIHVLRNFGPKPISRNALKIKVPQSTHRLAKSSQKEKKRLEAKTDESDVGSTVITLECARL